MSNLPKKEYPPLLPAGFHPVTVASLKQKCVDAFPTSTTRVAIMKSLETVLNQLRAVNVEAEIWVDGSFLTEKIDPDDSDIVVKVNSTFLRTANPAQRNILAWVASNLKATHKCHSFFFTSYPAGHKLYQEGESMFSYWAKSFGFSRNKPIVPKGIGVLSLT